MYMYIDRTRFQKGQLSFSVHVHVYIYAKGYHGIYILVPEVILVHRLVPGGQVVK